ncbi:molecular chaperone Hsp20 [Desulfosarcina ovata subsp. sediminis]|uniref:Molecular chaperone Hsp20 n=1 Tax=Desulfosarcina ovata subsp. sediminis TaxID=885957 RepID=A0A5K7ZY18_9BACT|nr:Hsp20/alpha crystallin family protein [Desulfosarcina ovata]BBO84990.1 molecular chaperone Hsp20 [Desulfosarcina ovata subsp. sediminis]
MFARRLFNYPSVGWDHPFAELNRMSRQMDRLANTLRARPGMPWMAAKVFPAVNLTEDKDKYYVRAELPGIKADALDIQVQNRKLTITGKRTIESEGENVRYHRREREAGKFSRIISLPGDIDANRVDAKMVDGMLTVAIGKLESSKPRQITVN